MPVKKVGGLKGKNQLCLVFLLLIVALSVTWQLCLTDEALYVHYPYPRMGIIRIIHSALITEELYKNGLNPFKTRVYYNGGKEVYAQEFPLYNILLVFLYKIFGINHTLGVYFSVFSFGIALILFYFFLKFYTDELSSLCAVFILAISPHSLFYGRMYMPLSLDILLMIANLYVFRLYLDKQSPLLLLSSGAILLLHLLQKGTFLVMGFVMLVMAYQRYGVKMFRKKALWLFALVPVLIMGAWYIYTIIASVQVRTGVGSGYFLPLKQIFNISYQFYVWKKFFRSTVILFSPLGIILTAIGIPAIQNKNLRSIALTWLGSFFVFGIFFPRVWQGHEYYYLFTAFAFSIGITAGVRLLMSKLSKESLKTALSVLLAVFYITYSWLMTRTDFKYYPIKFIEPVSARIATLTSPDSRSIFLCDYAGLWKWEWLFAAKRTGYQIRHTVGLDRIMNLIVKSDVGSVILTRWKYDFYQNPQELHPNLRHSLFREYRLADSFLDEYLLFDTDKKNAERMNGTGFTPLELKFANSLTLQGILIENRGNPEIADELRMVYDVSFFWKIEKHTAGNPYLLVLDNSGKMSGLSHKVMSNALPLKYWKKGWVYAERITICPSTEMVSGNIPSYKFYLYDRGSGMIYSAGGTNLSGEKIKELASLASELVIKENQAFKKMQKELRVERYSVSTPDWK